MSTTAKVILTLVLSAMVVSLIYFFPQFALSGIWQLRILALFGAYFILYAFVGLFRGEVFISRLGLAKKSENSLLFWYGIIIYFVLGTVMTWIVFMVSKLTHKPLF